MDAKLIMVWPALMKFEAERQRAWADGKPLILPSPVHKKHVRSFRQYRKQSRPLLRRDYQHAAAPSFGRIDRIRWTRLSMNALMGYAEQYAQYSRVSFAKAVQLRIVAES